MKLTLLADHHKFLCAEDGGKPEGTIVAGRPGGLLTAGRDHAGAWETFEYVTDGEDVGLKSSDGFFACCENEGKDGRIVFRSPAMGAWERFKAWVGDGGKTVSFEARCRPGYFIKAFPDNTATLGQPMFDMHPAAEPGPYETFKADPPVTGAIIPLAGAVRIVGTLPENFADDSGLFVPIGCHFGEAFSLWCRGRRDEVRNELRAIAGLGYDHVRVWDNLGYYRNAWHDREVAFHDFIANDGVHVPMTPNYYGQLDEFMSMTEQVGIRVLWSSGDMNSMQIGWIEEHLRQARSVYERHRHNVFGRELANERWQNYPHDYAEDEGHAAEIMRETFGGSGFVLYNSCPPMSGEDASMFENMVQNFFDSANVHGTREFGDPEFVMRRHFNYGYERYTQSYHSHGGKPYAMHSTEPGGPGSGVSVGNTEDVETLVGMHIATLIGRSATVYMSGHGVFYDGPITPQAACAEVGKLKTLFHPQSFSFGCYHGNRQEAWVTSEGGFADEPNDEGYGRVDQLVSDSHRQGHVILHGGRGHRRAHFKRNLSVECYSLGLQKRFDAEVSSGQSLDVGGNAFLVVRPR